MNDLKSIKARLYDADPYIRRDACEAIAESKTCDFIDDLVTVLNDVDPGVKEAALNALTSIGGEQVARAIAPLIKTDDASLRNISIEILTQVGRDGLKIIESLLGDTDDDVVKFGVDILSTIRDVNAFGMLSRLAGHNNPNIRAAVALCLGKIKAAGSVEILLKALKDKEEWVRFSAIEALGLVRSPIALAPLLDIVNVETGLTSEAAVEALSKIASASDSAAILLRIETLLKKGRILNVEAIVELIEKATSPGADFTPTKGFKEVYFNFFTKALEDSDRSVQLNALRGFSFLRMNAALAKIFNFSNSLNEIDDDTEPIIIGAVVSIIGHGRLPKILKDELKRSGSRNIKIIVKALGEMRSEEAVPLLKELIDTVSKPELREVVSALKEIGSLDSVAVLFNALQSTDGHTRSIAAQALASLAGELAVANLFKMLKVEQYKDVMETVTDSLALIPSDSVKKGFWELLNDRSEHLREMGARGLGLIGDTESVKYLRETSSDKSADVRKVVYKSIARLGISDTEDILLKGLNDTDDEVKLSVLKALGEWRGESIRKALIDVLKDSNIWVRYHAVLLLGGFPGDDTERTIIDLLARDAEPVKAAAAKTLEKIGSKRALAALEIFSDHSDPAVREAVCSAIGTIKCLRSV